MAKEMRPSLLKLIKVIGGAPGMLSKITPESPEYYGLEQVVSDEQAEFAALAGLRKERTVEWMAQQSGKSLEEAQKLCDELADIGIFSQWITQEGENKGKKVVFIEIFAPGTLERMVGNREQLAKHPEIARAFNEYTQTLGGKLGAMLPTGASLMRVIPVETAISGDPKCESIEKLSYYLDRYTQFSVSDCSCRASRRIMGEGCGHLEKDICLHVGPSAEYYANTGKARWITKEECLEILKNAEKNGLMHSIPNITDLGDTNAICNCCACSCFGLRIGLMFGARQAIGSNYYAEVDEEKCAACGACVEVCPGKAVKLGTKISTINKVKEDKKLARIDRTFFSAKKAKDVNYRLNRTETVSTGTSPCKAACPAHISVQAYLRLAAQEKFDEALELIKKENPFPAVCGRICNHPCETACSRNSLDQAVAIDEVKKFIADKELKAEHRYVPQWFNTTRQKFDEKIAIIGGGPAGLSCAYYLAEMGYTPTVFEKSKEVGGMLMYGIPSFRLEKDVIKAEISVLKDMGVQFKTGCEVGKDTTIAKLKEEGYKGFFIAIGAQGGRKLNVPGEDGKGVQSGVDFLLQVNQSNKGNLSGKTVVIGGGNVAVDVARTAVRVGKDDVTMICLEAEDKMPAAKDEVDEAVAEGIKLNCGWGPKEIVCEGGKVTKVIFKKCTQTIDPSTGKFDPKYDESQTMEVECSNVLVAVGQSIEWGNLLDGTSVELNPNKTAIADNFTYVSKDPDIFVGGDVYTGPRFAIDAIAAGKQAAISLHRHVHEGQTLDLGRNRREYIAFDVNNIDFKGFDKEPRQVPGYEEAKKKTFGDGRVDFTAEQIRKETARCLKCGVTKVDVGACVGCGICTTKCKFDAIHLVRKKKVAWGGKHETIVPRVLGYVATKPIRVVKHLFVKKD